MSKPTPLSHRRFSATVLAASLAFCAAGCQTGQIRNNVLSSSQENDEGRQYASQIDSQVKFVLDGKTNRRVLNVSTLVLREAQKDRPDVSFRVRVIDSPELNAFSIPGGYIYLYRGLLDKMGSDDDALACVIGHEAAHVVRRHVVKAQSDSENKGLLLDIASLLSRSYAINQVGGALFELDQLHYSRVAEFEADRWGERFAYNAGYDPSGMIRTFQIFEAEEKSSGQISPYARDHPINANRILRAEEQLRELRANRGLYVEENYNDKDDRVAALKNGIDYQALVLSTKMPTPASVLLDTKPKSTDQTQ